MDEKGRRALYPSVTVRNVVIFPGIPGLLKRVMKHQKYEFGTINNDAQFLQAFGMLHGHFRVDGVALHGAKVVLSVGEFDIAAQLTELQVCFHKSRDNHTT